MVHGEKQCLQSHAAKSNGLFSTQLSPHLSVYGNKHFPLPSICSCPSFKPVTWRLEGRALSSPHPHKALIITGPLCRLHASHRIGFMLNLCSLKRTLFLPHTSPSLSPFRPTRLSIFISLSFFLCLFVSLLPPFHFWSFAVLNLCQLR